jgi:hypothetical protein
MIAELEKAHELAFRSLLCPAHAPPAPPPPRIARCSTVQNMLLYQLANPRLPVAICIVFTLAHCAASRVSALGLDARKYTCMLG